VRPTWYPLNVQRQRRDNDNDKDKGETMNILISLLETARPFMTIETLAGLFVGYIGYVIWTTCVAYPRQYCN
jgi:hypothetical protein